MAKLFITYVGIFVPVHLTSKVSVDRSTERIPREKNPSEKKITTVKYYEESLLYGEIIFKSLFCHNFASPITKTRKCMIYGVVIDNSLSLNCLLGQKLT